MPTPIHALARPSPPAHHANCDTGPPPSPCFDTDCELDDFQTLMLSELATTQRQLERLTLGQASLEALLRSTGRSQASSKATMPHDETVSSKDAVSDETQISGATKGTASLGPLQESHSFGKGDLALPMTHTFNFNEQDYGAIHRNLSQTATSSRPRLSEMQEQINEREMRRLRRIIEVNQQHREKAKMNQQQDAEQKQKRWIHHIKSLDSHELEVYMDSWMSSVIVANAIFIGLSLDLNTTEGMNAWKVGHICFTVTFAVELFCKIHMQSARGHLCGQDRVSNGFDTALICIDVTQLFIDLFFSHVDMPSASLLRVVRLARLARMMRLLRTEIFKDLLAMIQGMIGGAFTLFWAIVMFNLMVYVTSLFCRELLGTEREPLIYENFSSVPRSMFTVFRCSFGDCNDKQGLPIPEIVAQTYGGFYGLAYCFFVFIITVGLLNVISAIFVNATLSAAAKLAQARSDERLLSVERWAENLFLIISELLDLMPFHPVPENWMESIEELSGLEFTKQILDHAIQTNTSVQHALTNLDIDVHDFQKLSDILDPDHSGTINVFELIDGLDSLRGEPRRSDIVSLNLMVRQLQSQADGLLHKMGELKHLYIGNGHQVPGI